VLLPDRAEIRPHRSGDYAADGLMAIRGALEEEHGCVCALKVSVRHDGCCTPAFFDFLTPPRSPGNRFCFSP
jgi:hypothetical protein